MSEAEIGFDFLLFNFKFTQLNRKCTLHNGRSQTKVNADSDNSMIIESIDTSNMCSHLQKKLLEDDGIYHSLWTSMQEDPELTAVVRSRQLHIYRNGKKVLILAGKAAPKVIREDTLCGMLPKKIKG